MIYEGGENLKIEIYDPIYKADGTYRNGNYDVPNYTIKQINNIVISETSIGAISTCTIVTSTVNAFCFIGMITYMIVKVFDTVAEITIDESTGKSKTTYSEICVWEGRVINLVNQHKNEGSQTVINCESLSTNLALVQCDYQKYLKKRACKIIHSQLEILLKGEENGSPTSLMTKEDYIDNIVDNNSSLNIEFEKTIRSPGSSALSNIRNVLEKSGLYFFWAMIDNNSKENKGKLILNNMPEIPTSLLSYTYTDTLIGTGETDSILTFEGQSNIIDATIEHKAVNYRDRIRIQYGALIPGKLGEVLDFNPQTDVEGFPKKKLTKSDIEVPDTEYVPMVLHRENFTSTEARKLINLLWNSVVITTPSISITVAGWEFMNKRPMVGMVVRVKIDITQNGQTVFSFSDEGIDMIITNLSKTLSIRGGRTMTITLTDKASFEKEVQKPKINRSSNIITSYGTNYTSRQ